MKLVEIDNLQNALEPGREQLINLNTFDDADICLYIVDILEEPLYNLGVEIEFVRKRKRNYMRIRKIQETTDV
jgi:hypothetical protein